VTALKALRTAVVSLTAVVCLALAAVTFLPPALGLEHYAIVGGSMDGTIDRGSVVFDEEVPVAALQRGDVITYTPPSDAMTTERITHRIVSIHSVREAKIFRTRGDANQSPDPWTFTLDQPRQARVVGHVPYLGYVLAALEIRPLRMALIGIPALLIAISVLAGMVGDAREERRLEEAELDPWPAPELP
jgi:signal peptidase I